MVAIVGPGGLFMATKIAVDGLGGPLVAGDQLQCDSTHMCKPLESDPYKSTGLKCMHVCSNSQKGFVNINIVV